MASVFRHHRGQAYGYGAVLSIYSLFFPQIITASRSIDIRKVNIGVLERLSQKQGLRRILKQNSQVGFKGERQFPGFGPFSEYRSGHTKIPRIHPAKPKRPGKTAEEALNDAPYQGTILALARVQVPR